MPSAAAPSGTKVNIPLSLELSGKLVNHWNMGTTIIPGNKESGGANADTFGYNFGTSLIWCVSENFNLMCEAVWNSPESVQADGAKIRNDTFLSILVLDLPLTLNLDCRLCLEFPFRLV